MIMAEVRCPMCGKNNPADLEVCQYCQARVKAAAYFSLRSRFPTFFAAIRKWCFGG